MHVRTLGLILSTGVLVTIVGTAAGHARDMVDILIRGRYFSADVRFIVVVEPDTRNRTLRIEADSDDMFRSSEITLNGADEKRFHDVTFRNLAAGSYRLRAQVRSTSDVIATTEDQVVVTGPGGQ